MYNAKARTNRLLHIKRKFDLVVVETFFFDYTFNKNKLYVRIEPKIYRLCVNLTIIKSPINMI